MATLSGPPAPEDGARWPPHLDGRTQFSRGEIRVTAIFGLWNLSGAPGAGRACADMQRALAIYGSDRSAIEEEGAVALGVTLARLTPEDRFDRQPLAGGGGRWLLVADLRLDNRPELAAALGVPSEALGEMADSALLLRAWERWQEGAIERLVGEFALAVFDARERRLTLARDFLGDRPLFYARTGGRIAFATMAKGIHALGDVAPAPDMDRLRDYLALSRMVGSNSFFAGISRVCPGEIVSFGADGQETHRQHFDWEGEAPVRYARDADYVEAFREIFDRAVADRMRTTGRVASHLSSGFDSSAVSVSAARQLGAAGKRLTAYTHVPIAGAERHEPPGRTGDEGPIAAEIAALYPNVDHVKLDSADRRIGADLESYFHYNEYPALNLCNVTWGRDISRHAARSRHAVLLTGAMGNATITLEGQERRAELMLSGQWLRWAREGLVAHRHGVSPWVYMRATLNACLPGNVANTLKRLTGRRTDLLPFYSALREDIFNSPAFRAHLREIKFDPTFRPFRSPRDFSNAVLTRLDISGLENKGTLAAHGIDTRDPTSDQRLVQFVRNIPSDLFNRDGYTRWIYRQAFGERLPPSVFKLRPKGYQASDWKTRLGAALPDLRAEFERARPAAGVEDLVNCTLLQADLDRGLPDDPPTTAQMETYRLRLLRGLSVVHFMGRLDRSNKGQAQGEA